MAKADDFITGNMYDLGDGGEPQVWGGKKLGWVSKERWKATRGETQAKFDADLDLRRRLDRARQIATDSPTATGFIGGLISGQGAPAWSPFKGIGAAHDLAQQVKPVRASAAFSNLQEMRQNNPTGAAVGSPSDTDMALLMAKDANLEVSQSREQFLEEVAAARRHLGRQRKGLTEQYPYDLRTDNPEDIPQGAFFIATNGKLYRNQRGAGAPGQTAQERASSFEYLGPEGR
jgi:hypothetical protein